MPDQLDSTPKLRHYMRAIGRRLRQRFICFGTLRHTQPVNLGFGIEAGTPVDRIYIEHFLKQNEAHIKGRVLEIGDSIYTHRFGKDKVKQAESLSFTSEGSPTYVGRLETMPEIPDNTFDCMVITQTLHYIFNMFDAVSEIHRVLKPGGVALVTVPGLSQISRWDMDRWGDRWRLTTLGAKELFETRFKAAEIKVESYGNALSALAFIQGIPAEKLRKSELESFDPDYQVVVAVVARKSTNNA